MTATNPIVIFPKQEDSKIYKNAQFLDKFFEECLQKFLPDYASKRSSVNGGTRVAYDAKRIRLDNQRSTEIIDDGDDDVILA